jgi:hypothetical protein
MRFNGANPGLMAVDCSVLLGDVQDASATRIVPSLTTLGPELCSDGIVCKYAPDPRRPGYAVADRFLPNGARYTRPELMVGQSPVLSRCASAQARMWSIVREPRGNRTLKTPFRPIIPRSGRSTPEPVRTSCFAPGRRSGGDRDRRRRRNASGRSRGNCAPAGRLGT